MNDFVLKPETRRQQVSDFLRGEILLGRRAAGSPLREVELSKQFGVSRGPIREAMRDLEKEGLVVVRPYAGTWVATISFEDLMEVYELRSAIEKKAFELIWTKRDGAFGAEFIRRHDALLAAVREEDGPGIVDAEQRFHGLPYEMCGNALLLDCWKQLSQRLRLCFLLHSEVFARGKSYADAHVSFLKTALSDDLDAMKREVDGHLEGGIALIRAAFSSTPIPDRNSHIGQDDHGTR